MTTKNYPAQIYSLSEESPRAYLFVVQAGTDGDPLTLAQLETARNAAASVLEIVGATVLSASAILELDPVPEGANARLVLEPRVELDDREEESAVS